MDAAVRAWRWLRGRAPLGALPDRPVPTVLAWGTAGLAALLIEAVSPLALDPGRALGPLLIELGLVAAVLSVAKRRRVRVPLVQALQATAWLAVARTLILAPVLLVIAAARVASATVLGVFLLVALVTVAAMAWLIRRYLQLWREALQVGARTAAGILLALAVALLLIEAAWA